MTDEQLADLYYRAKAQCVGNWVEHVKELLAAGASEGQAEHCAEIIDGWQIVYAGTGPVKPVIEKHGLKIGSKLYTHPSAEIAALRERIAGMEKDAERYRMIRNRSDYWRENGRQATLVGVWEEELDLVIDAAISKDQK